MKLLTFINPAKFGALEILRFAIKHYYWIILAIIIIPNILSAIQIAKDTSNPSYPVVALGLRLTNADHFINEDVETLRNNPDQLIQMQKPDKGIVKNLQYSWRIFLIFWRFFGNIWIIAFPFIFIYRILKFRNVSEVSKNITLTLILGILLVFIINLVLTIHGITTGEIEYNLPGDVGIYEKSWLIILTTLPFHGVINLIQYLINFI